jgi:hypothetical protein
MVSAIGTVTVVVIGIGNAVVTVVTAIGVAIGTAAIDTRDMEMRMHTVLTVIDHIGTGLGLPCRQSGPTGNEGMIETTKMREIGGRIAEMIAEMIAETVIGRMIVGVTETAERIGTKETVLPADTRTVMTHMTTPHGEDLIKVVHHPLDAAIITPIDAGQRTGAMDITETLDTLIGQNHPTEATTGEITKDPETRVPENGL